MWLIDVQVVVGISVAALFYLVVRISPWTYEGVAGRLERLALNPDKADEAKRVARSRAEAVRLESLVARELRGSLMEAIAALLLTTGVGILSRIAIFAIGPDVGVGFLSWLVAGLGVFWTIQTFETTAARTRIRIRESLRPAPKQQWWSRLRERIRMPRPAAELSADVASQRKPVISWQAIASIATVGTAIVTVVLMAQTNIQAAKSEESAGEVLLVSGSVSYWNSSVSGGDAWQSVPSGSTTEFEWATQPNRLYAIVEVVNGGRGAGAIRKIGFEISKEDARPVAAALCPTEGKLENCELPIRLEPAESRKIYVPLDDAIVSDITCNPWVEENTLTLWIRSVKEYDTYWPTGVKVKQSSSCESRPPEVGQASGTRSS